MKFKVFECVASRNFESLYRCIAEYLEEESYILSKQIFIKDLEIREEIGGLQVAKNFYLPHIQNDNIQKNIVLRIDNFKNNILFILLKENDEQAKKIAINLVKSLLEEHIRNRFLTCPKKNFEEINKVLSENCSK